MCRVYVGIYGKQNGKRYPGFWVPGYMRRMGSQMEKNIENCIETVDIQVLYGDCRVSQTTQ